MSRNQDSSLLHTSSSSKPPDDLDLTQSGSLSNILSAITDGLSSYDVTTDPPTHDVPSDMSPSPSLFQTLTSVEENVITGVNNMSSSWSGSTAQWITSIDPVVESSQLVTASYQALLSDNGTDTADARSTYFTNMMTWFIATGAIVAAVILLAFVNCCIENRNTIKKLLGLSKSKHPHAPGEEKRVRRDLKKSFEKSDDRDYQVHLLWSRLARSSTRKEQSHI